MSLLSLLFVSHAVSAATAATPVVISTRGSAQVMTGRDSEFMGAKAGLRLVEKAVLKTGPGGEIRLRLDQARILTLGEATRIELPGIRWEGGDVPVVEITEGRLRWEQSGGDGGVTLQSALFKLRPAAGDFLFFYDPRSPRAEVRAFAGEIDFMAQNAEDSVKVKARQKAVFQGVLEDGDIAADILLHGKRVPRGRLSKVEELSTADLAPLESEMKERAALEKKKKQIAAQRKVKEDRAGVICRSPKAVLNECVWTRSPSGCERRRCNANGMWAEPTSVETSLCRATATVRPCDY